MAYTAIVWIAASIVAFIVKHNSDKPGGDLGLRWDATPTLMLVLIVALGLTAIIGMWAGTRDR